SRIVTSGPPCVNSWAATSPASPAPRMADVLGARAGAGGESGVVRVPSEAHPERLAAARATRPRNSRRFIHLISRKSAVTAGARTAAPGGSWRTPWEQPPGASDTDWLSNHPLASHYN